MTRVESGRPALLCDADGCLFPSEDPAYDASAGVTADLLAEVGIDARPSAEELRLEFTGLNFRASAQELCRRHGTRVDPDLLEHWVGVERDVVTRHLGEVLQPDPSVEGTLRALAGSVTLAVVTSSARPRIDVCLEATGLSPLFATSQRFSAEDLRPPRSKPAPDVYESALRGLGVHADQALAVEDSEVGVRAAVAAGIDVLGLLQFVPPAERDARRTALMRVGALDVVDSWEDVARVCAGRGGSASTGAPVLAPAERPGPLHAMGDLSESRARP